MDVATDARPDRSAETRRGGIAWMVHNGVTPNLIMLLLLIGGVLTWRSGVQKEVFPDFDTDQVTVSVTYTGASPEEIEQGIILVLEEAVRGLDGIDEVRATAVEGTGSLVADLTDGVDQQRVFDDIRQEVDRITTFPDDADEPTVSLSVRRREVVELQVYGAVDDLTLRESAELVREALLAHPDVTQVDLEGVRDYEVSVEVPQETLRAYGLTMGDIAERLQESSVEVPAGSIDSDRGEVLVRVRQRRDFAREFARIPIVTTADGSVKTLEDLATIREAFADTDNFATFDDQPAIGMRIYRVGDQTPAEVAAGVYASLDTVAADLPPGIQTTVSRNNAELFNQRRDLLLKNVGSGLLIVLVVLGLFLELKLAFWVMMGIPISFMGTVLLMPQLDQSVNMISMFAFLIALGIVVDDAIVVGENVYEYRQRGMNPVDAAILGARDVGSPVYFAVLTNIVAFFPLAMIPGFLGKIWGVIPFVVCTTFAVSLFESLYILPAHLAHSAGPGRTRVGRWIHRKQQSFAGVVQVFIYKGYGPLLDRCVQQRVITLAAAVAILVMSLGYVASGRLGMTLMPRIESDQAVATAVLPVGSPLTRMHEVEARLLASAHRVAQEGGGDELVEGYYARISDNTVEVSMNLTDPEVRPLSTGETAQRWRKATGSVVDAESMKFQSDSGGPGGGSALNVDLSHRDIPTLERAAATLADRLAEFAVISEIDDGVAAGKQQIDLEVTEAGLSLGLTGADVARQLRNDYQGAEAIQQQRGRHEVTVRLRLPESERTSEYDLERLMVQTPDGGQVPLMDVARVTRGRAFTTINRTDGRRTMTVAADITPISETSSIQRALTETVLPQLMKDYPGLTWSWAGRQADQSESTGALAGGLLLALGLIYFLLAIPFKSYFQPIIVMSAIPFGVVGAIIGHVIMGYTLSVVSLMGIIALAGVVVNDSLVLIQYANQIRDEENLSAVGRSTSPGSAGSARSC